MIAADQGQAEEALSLARQHLPIARDNGRLDLSVAFSRVGYVLAHAGRTAGAVRILSCSEVLTEEIDATEEPWVVRQNERTRAIAREELGETAFAEAWEEGRALTPDEAVSLALRELERDA